MRDINYRKFAHEYSTGNTLNILFGWKGTFWPLVIMRWEVYIYPAIHIALVVWMGLSGQDDPGEEGSGEDDTVVGGADGSGDGLVSMLMAALNPPSDDAPPPFWGSPKYMVPWSVLSLLTPLMIFFLVFFLSQCYNRFNSFFATSMAIEGSLQNLTMLMLAHVTDPAKQKLKWDAVRYLTAAAMVIYSRVSKIAMGKEAQMDIENWGRLLKRERFWQAEGGEVTLTLTPSPSPSPSTSPSPSHHHLTPSPPNKLTLAPSRPHGLMASTPSTLTFTITT